jgi:hypothetical protein
VDLCGGEDWGKLALVYAYAVAGQAGQARRILAEWQSAVRPAPVPSLPLTLVYIALGDRERALASLQQALAQHQAGVGGLSSPVYDLLHADPQCEELLRRAGAAHDS